MVHDILEMLEHSISDIFPDIFNRQYFIVYPEESIHLASICLIPAIGAYNSVIVINDNYKPLGVIRSRDILNVYYKKCIL